jgi:hypothetical protein
MSRNEQNAWRIAASLVVAASVVLAILIVVW